MLTIELTSLQRGPVDWEELLPEPGNVWADIDTCFIGPMRLTARAESSWDGSVHVEGQLVGKLALRCRRCLTEMEHPLELPLDLWFQRGRTTFDAGEPTLVLDREARTLDLTPVLREELLLAVPEYPICRAECEGFCPQCGARRGVNPCECSRSESDPRWKALRAHR